MTDTRPPTLQERLRPVCAVLGGIGAVLSVLASFVAVEAFSMGGFFYTLEYHSGGWSGAVAFLMAMLTVGGAIVVRRSPALGSTLMYIGGCGGFPRLRRDLAHPGHHHPRGRQPRPLGHHRPVQGRAGRRQRLSAHR